MEVVYEGKDINAMVNFLEKDLERHEHIKSLSRVPEPSRGRRYREVLLQTFNTLGSLNASVIIEFKDGLIRRYVFLGKVLPKEDADSFLDMPFYAEGYIYETIGDRKVYRVFNPYIYPKSREIFRIVKSIGDKFRLSDLEVHLENITESLDFDFL